MKDFTEEDYHGMKVQRGDILRYVIIKGKKVQLAQEQFHTNMLIKILNLI